MQQRITLIGFTVFLLFNLTNCGGEDSPEGAPQSLAIDSIPEYYADPALPSDYEVASAAGLVAGLEIHKSRLIVKINANSTTAEVNELLESIQAKVAGRAGIDLVYVELINNPTQEDLVWAMAELEGSSAIDIAVEDILVGSEEGGEITITAHKDTSDTCEESSIPRASEWTGTYYRGDGDRAWNRTAPSGNWWLEFIRMPAVWNFNDAIKRRALKESKPADELSPPIGVVDVGFQSHPDLPLINNAGVIADCHGNMVAGVIAATHDKHSNKEDNKGMEGIHPFARIMDSVVSMITHLKIGAWLNDLNYDPLEKLSVSQIEIITSIESMLDDHPDTRVINISYGIGWNECLKDPINRCNNPDTDAATHRVFRKYAQLAWKAIKDHNVLIVSAAGNSSDLVDASVDATSYGAIDARWISPLNFLALEGTVDNEGNLINPDNILVVEAVGWHELGGRRYFASSTGGQIAAPGMCITSTSLNEGYASKSGTSFAAPIIAGLADYLWTLDPTLSVADVVNAITGTAWSMPNTITDYRIYRKSCGPITNDPADPDTLTSHTNEPAQPPIVDAFSAVMTLDNAVEMLVDADDGTVDGVTVTGPGADTSLPGDGQIDMADFRAFRDAVAQLSVTLEQPSHIKRDNNRDGCVFGFNDGVLCSVREEIWSRFDFNGDGKLSETDTAGLWLPNDSREFSMPGHTDLDVLRSVWPGQNDNWDLDCANANNPLSEGWCETDLQDLLNSRDIIVDFSSFDPQWGETIQVRVNIGDFSRSRIYRHGDEPVMVFTIPDDADCALTEPVNSSCHRYKVSVTSNGVNIVTAGGVNHDWLGASTLFYQQPFGHDERLVIEPQVTFTLTPFAGKSFETEMTAVATYTFDDLSFLFDPSAKSRRDEISLSYCAVSSCVEMVETTRVDAGMSYRFTPIVNGEFNAYFRIRNFCESSNPAECPAGSPISNLVIPFTVVAGTPPKPPLPEPPPPEPTPPEPEPDQYPIILATAGWSFTDPIYYEIDMVCDEGAGTQTTTKSGTRYKWPTKSDPSRIENFSETSTNGTTTCFTGRCPNWSKGGNASLYYALRCSSTFSSAGYGGPVTIHKKTAVNGHRGSCDSGEEGACLNQVPWANWWTGNVYYVYEVPENVYPEYPASPEL